MKMCEGRDGDRSTLDPLEEPEGGCKFPSFEVAKGVGPSMEAIPCLLTPCFDIYSRISIRVLRQEAGS